ncbi:MAG: glycosyltransferase family 4 protein [Gammaproteobacteria bacterium]|nr:glycosyltransferase family 4 protein [Gammaproteobacteria bacterium]
MEVYADALALGLRDLDQPRLELTRFRPHSRFADVSENLWGMRLARYWDYPRQIKATRADVYHIIDHGYAHLLGALRDRPRVITVHDLIPILRWKNKINGSNPSRKPWLSEYSMKKIANADQIIAVSNNTKKDILENYDVPEDKIRVIYLGIDPAFRAVSKSEVAEFKKTMNWKSDNNVRRILISGNQFYKNHETALEVFKRIKVHCDFPVKLVNSRKRTKSLSTIAEKLGISRSDVEEIYVEQHAQMPLLLNSVDCLLFPSLYEGFGMPVLEALACGTPVVCSDRGSLAEVAGGMARVHDVYDIEGMADSILEILYSEVARGRLLGSRKDLLNRFSWRETARQTFDEYLRASDSA